MSVIKTNVDLLFPNRRRLTINEAIVIPATNLMLSTQRKIDDLKLKAKKEDGLYSFHTDFFENTSGFMDSEIQQRLNLNMDACEMYF